MVGMLTYVVVSDGFAVVARLAHIVSFFERGRVAESCSAAAVFHHSASERTQRCSRRYPSGFERPALSARGALRTATTAAER